MLYHIKIEAIHVDYEPERIETANGVTMPEMVVASLKVSMSFVGNSSN